MYKTGRASLRVSLVEGRHPPLKLRELGQLPECTKSRYFTQMFAISHMETALNLSILRVHLVDLITDTRKTLQSICDFLHLECTEGYLKTCEASIFKELSQTKNMVEWYPELKTSVESWIKQIPWLQRYSFSKDWDVHTFVRECIMCISCKLHFFIFIHFTMLSSYLSF